MLVLVGASWGGMRALQVLLGGLPATFPLPLVIVQHRDPETGDVLPDFLQRHCALPVSEPDDKEPVQPAHVYLAPRDYHLLIERNATPKTQPPKPNSQNPESESGVTSWELEVGSWKLGLGSWELYFALSTAAPVLHARPAIDVLFESAADACSERVIGILLTGTGSDGAHGLAALKARGGITIVQDPAIAERTEMPTAALAATTVDYVLPLEEIAPWVVAWSRGRIVGWSRGRVVG